MSMLFAAWTYIQTACLYISALQIFIIIIVIIIVITSLCATTVPGVIHTPVSTALVIIYPTLVNRFTLARKRAELLFEREAVSMSGFKLNTDVCW